MRGYDERHHQDAAKAIGFACRDASRRLQGRSGSAYGSFLLFGEGDALDPSDADGYDP